MTSSPVRTPAEEEAIRSASEAIRVRFEFKFFGCRQSDGHWNMSVGEREQFDAAVRAAAEDVLAGCGAIDGKRS